jgi:hypothetical protein
VPSGRCNPLSGGTTPASLAGVLAVRAGVRGSVGTSVGTRARLFLTRGDTATSIRTAVAHSLTPSNHSSVVAIPAACAVSTPAVDSAQTQRRVSHTPPDPVTVTATCTVTVTVAVACQPSDASRKDFVGFLVSEWGFNHVLFSGFSVASWPVFEELVGWFPAGRYAVRSYMQQF